MAKVLPPSRRIAEHTRVDNASHILKRYYVAERTLLRTLAAWFVGTSQWDPADRSRSRRTRGAWSG